LRFLQKNLDDWHDKLGVFTDMLDTRKRAFAERLPQVRERASQTGLAGLLERRDAIAAAIEKGEADGDGAAFADAKQRDLMARIESSKALVESNDPELAKAKDRVRHAAGAMTWQLAQDYTVRLYTAKKDLVDIDQQIVAAKNADAALAQAQRDEPAKFDAFAKRIAALDPLLQIMIPRVAALAKEQQVALQDIAVAELTRQKERLAIYSTQARFAVAQLYDRATVKKEGEHASAK
jgi:hypothetical protein